jgi:DNA-binding GntR family transcriptional regulator
VCELGPDDIRDIYRLRMIMELEGVRAAGQLRPEQEQRLNQAVEDFEAAAASKDVAHLVAADIREAEQPGPLIEEHRQICLHLIQGDTTAAAELLTAHLRRFGERLYEVFSRLDNHRGSTATSGRDEKRVSAAGPAA